MNSKHDIGETVFLKATINEIKQVSSGQILYKAKELPDIYLTDDDFLETAIAKVKVDRSEVDALAEDINELNRSLERASVIIDKLAHQKESIKISAEIKT